MASIIFIISSFSVRMLENYTYPIHQLGDGMKSYCQEQTGKLPNDCGVLICIYMGCRYCGATAIELVWGIGHVQSKPATTTRSNCGPCIYLILALLHLCKRGNRIGQETGTEKFPIDNWFWYAYVWVVIVCVVVPHNCCLDWVMFNPSLQ